MNEKRLVVLDGHSVAFRAFYATDPQGFKTPDGEYTNASYGFMNMLIRMVNDLHPSYLAVAFDLSRFSFRTEEYAEYKGGRAETPEEFRGQIERIQQLLSALGITWLTKENYEADDIVATLARTGRENDLQVFIASGDRDTFQLVTDQVTVMYPGSSMRDLRNMTPAAIEERYGVGPQRYPELAALTGEAADNLPGVPGVGPKTAAQWLNKYDGLDNLLAHATEIKGKRGAALIEHREDVLRNRRLNRLVDDLELDCALEDLKPRPALRQELFQLCDQLAFGRIRMRLLEMSAQLTGESAEGVGQKSENTDAAKAETNTVSVPDTAAQLPTAQADISATQALRLQGLACAALANGTAQEVTDLEAMAEFLRRHECRRQPAETAAILTDPAQLTATAPGAAGQLRASAKLSLYVMGNYSPATPDATELVLFAPGEYLKLDFLTASEQQIRLVADYLATNNVFTYNAKGSAHALASRGITLPLPSADVQLWSYLLHANGEAELDYLTADYLGRKLPDVRELLGAAAFPLEAARAIWELAQVIGLLLENSPHMQLLRGIEEPTQRVLAQMETDGIAIACPVLQAQADDLDHQIAAAEDRAQSLAGEPVNLASPKQLQHILFEVLDMPKTKKTKTGYTTNAKALADLLERTQHPFLQALMEHRDAVKLRQIIEGLLAAVADDKRIHTTFMQTVTTTGRLSSKNPNLQNIPARSEEGLRIRAGFVPGPGYEALLTADYSQIEMRIMAHMSGDEALISAFAAGEDLHRTMAAMVFDLPADEVTATLRNRIKATSYGLAYGLSAYGLSQQIGVSVPEARELRDTYFERFGKVQRYLHQVVEEARVNGYTATMFGRRRYLPELNSSNRQIRENAERAALNAPIQGTAADIIKIAMCKVADALKREGLKSRILLQVHDELVLEVADGESAAVTSIVREEMEHTVKLSVPLSVSVGIGESWRAAAH